MKLKGSTLLGAFLATGFGVASLASCDNRPEWIVSPVEANEAGTGGSGGVEGSGGEAGTGGQGGSEPDYPDYFDGLSDSLPEVMEVVNCVVGKIEEEKEGWGTLRFPGAKFDSLRDCGPCAAMREILGKQAMKNIYWAEGYIDCDNDLAGCVQDGALYVPQFGNNWYEVVHEGTVNERNKMGSDRFVGLTTPNEFHLVKGLEECVMPEMDASARSEYDARVNDAMAMYEVKLLDSMPLNYTVE